MESRRMVKKIKRILIIFVCFVLTSCSMPKSEDALDKAPDSIQAAEDSLKGAIIYGHHDLVKEAVEEGADINQFLRPARWESKKFATPLSLAIQESPVYMEEYLIELGADINSLRTDYYNPAIYWAYLHGKKADTYMDYLIKHNIDLTEQNADGNTVLDCVVMRKNVYDDKVWEKAQYLINLGVPVRKETINAAAKREYGNSYLPKLVRILEESGKDTGLKEVMKCAILSDNDGVIKNLSTRLKEDEMQRLLLYSCAYCSQEVFKSVLQKGKEMEYSKTELLKAAARAGNFDNVKYLVEELEVQDIWKEFQMSVPAMEQEESNKHYEIVDYLIDKGFEIPKAIWIDGKGNLLSAAVVNDDQERLKELLNNKESIPARFEVVIVSSIEEKNMDMFKFLYDYAIENHIEANEDDIILKIMEFKWDESSEMIQYILDKKKITAEELNYSLRDAIDFADVRAVKLLLEAGADPNALDIPSHAVYDDNLEIIKLLVEYGLDVNHEAGLVEYSAMYSNGVMTYLMNQGADISADGPNSHALFYAVNKGRIQNAKTLLDAGIDTTIKNKDGNTAYDMALMGGIDEMIALFDQE